MGWGGLSGIRTKSRSVSLSSGQSFEYIRAVEGVDEVRVRVWVDKMGRTSLTFGFSVLPIDEDTLMQQVIAYWSVSIPMLDNQNHGPMNFEKNLLLTEKTSEPLPRQLHV